MSWCLITGGFSRENLDGWHIVLEVKDFTSGWKPTPLLVISPQEAKDQLSLITA